MADSFIRGEESAGSGAEGRARKRFQRTASTENEAPQRRATGTTAFSPTKASESKSSFAARRRSTIRDHKPPLGPRPFDYSSSKRIVSENIVSQTQTNRSFQPNSTAQSQSSSPSKLNNPRYSFGNGSDSLTKTSVDTTGQFDFLPSINFDEFHTSITSYEPQLSEFPAPGGVGNILGRSGNGADMDRKVPYNADGSVSVGNTSGVNRTQSLIRRLSNAPRNVTQTNASSTSSMPPPSAPLSLRTRRQSQYPAPAAANPAARPPRKSVGPGLVTPTLQNRGAGNESVPSTPDNTQSGLMRSASIGRANRKPTNTSMSEVPRLATATRSSKAKSMVATPRQASGLLIAPSMTPDQPFPPVSINNSKSPGKSPARRTNTPSSTNRRQSTLPHVTGLGARTISPTDARRLKRMSMAQPANAPPVPLTPPTPQPDTTTGRRSRARSPSRNRKSATPVSARNTPDPNRKSFSSHLSLSSQSSHQSLRTVANQNMSTSRLPTPKARNVPSAAGISLEDVPPVPAIPKAYESPKETIDQPFFSSVAKASSDDRSESLSFVSATDSIHKDSPTTAYAGAPSVQMVQPTDKKEGRHRRGLTVGAAAVTEKVPAAQNASRKNLQPIRLPPLNLLPLSTPTAARIASLPAPSAEVDDRHKTPPPRRHYTKTPSTPMTASKASFFSRHHHEEEEMPTVHMRSASSHHGLRSDSSSYHIPTSSTPDVPVPRAGASRNATTPFASTSLPKGSGDYTHLRGKPSSEFTKSTATTEQTATKVNGPRMQFGTRLTKESSSSTVSTEPETPSSGTSLRRKLSLGWKRSSSKAANAAHKGEEEQAPQPPKHSDMPPPRLPASATWSGPSLTAGETSTLTGRPSLDATRRKVSGSSMLGTESTTPRANGYKPHVASGSYAPATQGEQTTPVMSKSNSSIMTPVQRILGSKSSIGTLKARNLDTNLDRDDLAADEEMKRLASKQRDFEKAAKEVDELRKRAHPKERVTPAQALQAVSLNIFERGEIIDYKEVYFCGTKNAQKHVGDLNAQTANFGYDDERGDYNIVLGDHLAYRYEVVDLLGKGSFGQVVRCIDHKTGGLVAVKIIRNKKRFHQQALVEVQILQKLRDWDPQNRHSMINFTQSFYFRGHLCISTELLGINLYEFIKAHDFKGFNLKLIKRFTKQMLSSLCLLQQHKVIHCDLKPENILLAHPLHSEIKVIDFGSSCFENEKVYTYIQSRFYRSPEVILGMSYGMPIDMWSLGCILAELLTGYPIFPGENEQEQLACIMEIFGPPEKHLIEKSTRKKLFFDSMGKPRVTVSSKGRRRRPSSKTLEQALKCNDEAFLDFLSRCLRWDPDRRMKPDEAVNHEFITGVKRPTATRSRTHIGHMMAHSAAHGLNSSLNHPPLSAAGSTSSSVASTGTSSTAAKDRGTAHASPIKRFNTVQTPSKGIRPLPEPPATSFKSSAGVNGLNSSPIKSANSAMRRHSTVTGQNAYGSSVGSSNLGSSIGVKRTSNGAAVGGATAAVRQDSFGSSIASIGPPLGEGYSALPRYQGAQRSFSGKTASEMASAAALSASLRSR